VKKQVYKRRHGARFPGDVQKIGERIARIEKRGGDVPAGVVEDARDQSSPCHAVFDWDDSSAAHTQRIEQARSLIRKIHVVIVGADGAEIETRAFQFVTIADREEYTSIETILSDAGAHADLLARARKALQSFVDNYKQLSEMRGVIAEAVKVLPKRRQRQQLRKAG